MKKIWKNLCVCSMAVACGVGMVGCGKEEGAVSKDLDGDGVISSWETLFDNSNTNASTSVTGEITYINNASDLLAINDRVEESGRIYLLANDIDLGGREISINLGNSELYGNNHIISNFKLGSHLLSDEKSNENEWVRCLFYGGIGIYDVKIFMGLQSFNLNTNNELNTFHIATCVNVPYINNVSVKGKIDITAPKVKGRSYSKLDVGLLYAQKTTIETIDETNSTVEHLVSIRNVSVDGAINYVEEDEALFTTSMGGVASAICNGSAIYNVNANIEINANSSEKIYVGGVVGINNGFISTVTCSGNINLSHTANTDNEFVGGIVGVNNSLSELKNIISNVNFTHKLDEEFVSFNRSAQFIFGGAVGYNKGGILEYVESNGKINLDNIYSVIAGGICGRSDKGIISYAICRGEINVKNCDKVLVSQISGKSNLGLIEKVITTTQINIDNSAITSSVYVGMGTIFEDINNLGDEFTAGKAPHFKYILVDGITSVYMKEGDTFKYELGLRNSFKNYIGTRTETDEEGNEIEVPKYEIKVPEIFSNIYHTNKSPISTTGCQLYKYEEKNGQKIENSPVVTYAKDGGNTLIKASGSATTWLIHNLDFKNFLNHNEVNISNGVTLAELHFTLDKSLHELSYFGGNKYNGELAYFDREFTQSFVHEASSFGNCEYDSQDEFLSYLYDIITTSSVSTNSSFKIGKDFLNTSLVDSDEYTTNADRFAAIISNVFTCLNTPVEVTCLNSDKVDVSDDVNFSTPRYILATFEDENNLYELLFDIDNLIFDINGNEIESANSEFIIFLNLTIY